MGTATTTLCCSATTKFCCSATTTTRLFCSTTAATNNWCTGTANITAATTKLFAPVSAARSTINTRAIVAISEFSFTTATAQRQKLSKFPSKKLKVLNIKMKSKSNWSQFYSTKL